MVKFSYCNSFIALCASYVYGMTYRWAMHSGQYFQEYDATHN